MSDSPTPPSNEPGAPPGSPEAGWPAPSGPSAYGSPPPAGWVPPQAPPSPPDRARGWVLALAVIAICLGGLGLVGQAFTLLQLAAPGIFPGARAMLAVYSVPGWGILMVAMAVAGPLLAVLFLAGGIGALRLRSWARKVLVFTAALQLLFSLAGMVMMTAVPAVKNALLEGAQAAVAGNPGAAQMGGVMEVMMVVGTAVGLLFALVMYVPYLVVFTRRRVREQFQAAEAYRQGPVPGEPGAAPYGG